MDLMLQTCCLNDLINHAEDIHKKIACDFMFEDLKTMNILYKDLDTLNKTMYTAQQKISDIYNKARDLFAKRISNFRNTLLIVENVSAPDSENDTFRPILSDKYMKQLITPDQKYKIVAPGVKIPVVVVDNVDDLPNCNIYYIKKIAQFAIKINGQILRGNIGHIVTNKKSKCIRPTRNITKCDYGSQCHNVNIHKCNFYHDVYDYTKYTTAILDERIKQNIHIRNFTTQNWLYTNESSAIKNNHMKHIGSQDRLFAEIPIVSGLEIDRLKDLLIHDILVSLAIYHNKDS